MNDNGIEEGMKRRQCKQCKNWWPPIFFESGGTSSVGTHTYRNTRLGHDA
jgi:hypothetical protein